MSNNNQIRRTILEALYKVYNEDPDKIITCGELADAYQLNLDTLKIHGQYLADKGYIELHKVISGGNVAPYGINITHTGIDIVESESGFNSLFPVSVNQNINIHSSTVGNIQGQGTISGDVSNIQNFIGELEKRIQDDSNIPEEEKTSLLKYLPSVAKAAWEILKPGIGG